MAEFAQALSANIDEPVIDMTGLPGTFDIALDVTLSDLTGLRNLMQVPDDLPAANTSASSIVSAIQELGLKLDRRKSKIDHLVIDRIEKIPAEN